jgi:hypothetical protein
VAALPRRGGERDDLLGLEEPDRPVVGLAALVGRTDRFDASPNVAARIAWPKTDASTWRCLLTVRGPIVGSASRRAKNREIPRH